MYSFKPFGPYAIDVEQGSPDCIERNAIPTFWAAVEKDAPGLADAIGCYLFGMRSGGGTLPWYVGKTQRSFREEVFEPHKFEAYHHALAKVQRGTPVMYLVANMTEGDRFTHNAGNTEAAISILETLLIGTAFSRNEELINHQQTHLHLCVPGYMNDKRGARSASAKSLASLLGVQQPLKVLENSTISAPPVDLPLQQLPASKE